MKKVSTNTSKKLQEKQKEEGIKQLILRRVNPPDVDRFTDDNFDNYNQKESILDMAHKMPYRKYISKKIRTYKKKYRRVYYDEMFRLTGIKPNKDKPHLKPHIFAKHTLNIIYNNFPNGIISYFNENNKADANGHRLYKHFQLLNQLGETKLLLIIEDSIRVMGKANNWSHFLRLWGEECGTPYQGTLFENH